MTKTYFCSLEALPSYGTEEVVTFVDFVNWSCVLHMAACHSLTVLVIVIPSCYLLTKYASRLTFYIIVKHIDQGTI